MKDATLLEFVLNIDPVPQPRPRATRRGCAKGVRMYEAPKSHKIHDFKTRIALEAHQRMAGKGSHKGAVGVWMSFEFAPPKVMTEKGLLKREYLIAHGPDVDNLAKGVLDALTRGGVWVDDKQVCSLSVHKRFANVGEPSKVGIRVVTMGAGR